MCSKAWQDLFLKSSNPAEALNVGFETHSLFDDETYRFQMHRDLLQWDQALKLAQRYVSRPNLTLPRLSSSKPIDLDGARLAPGEIPSISREYGQQLELT